MNQDFRISLKAGFISGGLATVFFLMLLLEVVFGKNLSSFGNYPRSAWGLVGILTSPLLHQDITHLLGNLLPVCGGVFLIGLLYPEILSRVLIITWVATGVLVWIFARPAYHIGSSGIGYGLMSFLFFMGLLRKDPNSIALSLLVLLTQSTMIIGWLPTSFAISYESHAAGIVIGTLLAILHHNHYSRQVSEIVADAPVEETTVIPPPQPIITITPQELGNSYAIQQESQKIIITSHDLNRGKE